MDDIYKDIGEYIPNKKRKILIVFFFYDMDVDMLINKKLNTILTELFIKGRKLNLSLASTKTIRLYSTNYFIMKIPNKRELH